MNSLRLLVFIFVSLIYGCANIHPNVKKNELHSQGDGYIAANYTRSDIGGYAFVLTEVNTGVEYAMSLGEDNMWPMDVKDQVKALKVPPGKYTFSHYFTYGTLTKEKSANYKVYSKDLKKPFNVDANTVVFLGNCTAERSAYIRELQVKFTYVSKEIAKVNFNNAYPLLSNLSFNCLFCID